MNPKLVKAVAKTVVGIAGSMALGYLYKAEQHVEQMIDVRLADAPEPEDQPTEA